jgi:SAM-dependent methyltransferase
VKDDTPQLSTRVTERRFEDQPLAEVAAWLSKRLEAADGAQVAIEVPDPELGASHERFNGEAFEADGLRLRHRGFRAWVDLAEQLGARLRAVRPGRDPRFVAVTFERLPQPGSLRDPPARVTDPRPDQANAQHRERYGASSAFARLRKLEEPSLALTLQRALTRIDLPAGARILDLGVNDGEELEALPRAYGERAASFEVIGVDHSASAIERARRRFADSRRLRCTFHCADINELDTLPLGDPGRFDLLWSIGTLHSPSIGDKRGLVMDLVQRRLSERGAVLLGFPNCRYSAGEVVYGARARHHRRDEAELSTLLKDIDFCRRYLQQHRFRLSFTGKYYLLLTATRLSR